MIPNEPKPITLVLPYYINVRMLLRQIETWSSYPQDLKDRLHVIVVDDCSPTDPASMVFAEAKSVGIADARLYRLSKDIRWNWLACRNLGAKEMETDWGLFTDIDHLVPEETLRNLVYGWHDKKMTHRFSRKNLDGSEYKPHPNSWFLTRARYFAIGGYDERFSGYYGTDYDFRDRAQAHSKAVIILDDALIRVDREDIADASTTTYERKTAEDRRMVQEIRVKRAAQAYWEPLHFQVPWERVA